jgi:transcriptional regulator with XRE-family HTH domain
MNKTASRVDMDDFGSTLTTLRQRAGLSRKKLAERAGIPPGLVGRIEGGEELPDEETKGKLEQVLSCQLYLPPPKLATVRIGEWANQYDERIAPFAREMLIAGFSPMGCRVTGAAVWMVWYRSDRLADFLNVVAEQGEGPDELYYRMNPETETAGNPPGWTYAVGVDDLNWADVDEESNDTPYFLFSIYLRFPLQDLPTVAARLKAHNQRGDLERDHGDDSPGGSGENMCEVVVRRPDGGTESLWACRLSEETAMITNLPFFTDAVAFHDLVRVSPGGEFLEVLESVTRTRRARYDAVAGEAGDRQWKAIADHFEKEGILTESAVPGVFGMAVPEGMDEERFRELCKQCPVPLKYPEGDPG